MMTARRLLLGSSAELLGRRRKNYDKISLFLRMPPRSNSSISSNSISNHQRIRTKTSSFTTTSLVETVLSSSSSSLFPVSDSLGTPTTTILTSNRCFSTKRKYKKGKGNKRKSPQKKKQDIVKEDDYYAKVYRDNSADDWEDDIEIPFGQPMIPTAKKIQQQQQQQQQSEAEEDEDDTPVNALQSVIESGLNDLRATSTLISNQNETKKSLFHKDQSGVVAGEETPTTEQQPTKQQLAEANRVLTVAQNCLEEFDRKGKSHPLTIRGQTILLLHVDVNSNLREATVFWALPLELMYEIKVAKERLELIQFMQQRLEESGGAGSFLQRHVHTILRSYYPPKLKFKPAPDDVLQDMLYEDDDW